MESLEEESGTTASERFLARLCKRAFLSLWSYPNVFKDQGKKDGKGDGKELCDLMVVFGNDVLLFSDKHCELRTNKAPDVAWRRWYTAAVLDSAGQLHGAERWLREHPSRLFQDRKCETPLGIQIPSSPTFHRILTCRGAADVSRRIWGGTGSLFVTNEALKSCATEPFHLGAFDDQGRMYHVFEEVALEAVLNTLDTVADFCEYLVKRERFFRRKMTIVATGEEDLLGFYLLHGHSEAHGHDFVVPDEATHVSIDESYWQGWVTGRQRRAKVEADASSYNWDRLIERFTHHGSTGSTSYTESLPGRRGDLERPMRWMARESRVRRRMLADSLIEIMQTTSSAQLRRRLVRPSEEGDPYWVFFICPGKSQMEYAQYRHVRQQFLIKHCYVVKHLFPDAKDIMALAVEPPNPTMSEDIVYFDAREWDEEMDAEAKQLREKLQIFTNMQEIRSQVWEFPVDDLPEGVRSRSRDDAKKKRKKARKAQKEQRRRGRR